ncbi:hypothetical protein KEM09_21640 [Carboxylicivirga mesophila]|uniref:Lipoprotein n=1 Tax=Carboxylicivirga mesophila TaxID=1166478 RepID=A0ABS5KG77_9BACT|nr:hypothetical protein [Carboxylicivirga mesophila]MBS2214026.1 hypothetical protein [Carboxylicivirga mesophila]
MQRFGFAQFGRFVWLNLHTLHAAGRWAQYTQMKQIFIIAIIVLSSCSFNKPPSKTLEFCDNELKLLCYDSLAPITNYNLADIRNNVWTKFDSTFKEYYCRQVKLKVNFRLDSINSTKLLLYSNNYQNCDDSKDIPPFNPYVHWIHIYLDKNDSLLIRRKLTSLDSVKNEVIKRYHELPTEKYFRVNIALLWDLETNQEKFSKLIKDCLEGYIYIANEVSMEAFQKTICDLEAKELAILNQKVPFKLRTDFWEGIPENYDFVGHELPPPPKESEMKILDLNE